MWSLRGSISGGFIALRGEAGFQPEVLRGGYHFFVPFQYRVHKVPLVTITQGQIGYVFARDGVALAPVQTLASNEGRRRLRGRARVSRQWRAEGGRSARSSARAPMPSTSRNSSC